jgi:DNA-binding NarL/FixJ family response regulator
MSRITVLLVDDHTIVRQGLRALLETDLSINVVGEAENGRQALQMAKRFQPDVVVMDIAMPSLNGLEATRQMKRECPRAKVLALSSYGDDEYVQRLIDAGAKGYLVKQSAAQDLLIAIRETAKGNSFFSASISTRLKKEREGHGSTPHRRKRRKLLTLRQSEVLQLVAEGYANKRIAGALSISIKTVEKHRLEVMKRLDLHDVAGLTRYAVAQGIVEHHVIAEEGQEKTPGAFTAECSAAEQTNSQRG